MKRTDLMRDIPENLPERRGIKCRAIGGDPEEGQVAGRHGRFQTLQKRSDVRVGGVVIQHLIEDALVAAIIDRGEYAEGPFCILSAVDNRCYKRILYEVLDHDPTHADIRAFLERLKTAMAARDLTLFGVTTDGSALYPAPLREVFGDVPHQICTF